MFYQVVSFLFLFVAQRGQLTGPEGTVGRAHNFCTAPQDMP
jgi:hypothetical protein